MDKEPKDEDWGNGYRDGLLQKPMQIVSASYDAGYAVGKKVGESEIVIVHDQDLE